MPKISPDKLEIGMKLIKPVVNKNGMVLLGEGVELTEKWIERIIDMDIDSVYVEGLSQQEIPKEEMLAQLEARFRYVKDKPYMNLIKKAAQEHIEGLYG
ncbi:MAG: hypothetical protein U1C55_10305 [Smithellaceae bacterium]|nr:hypothetical protein [Smithellaceae bacterium]